MHHIELGDPGSSVVTDVKASTNLADAAVAADQILAFYFFGLAGFDIPYSRDHRGQILNEVLEGDSESHVDFRLRLDRSLENRLDRDLGHPHCGFDRLRTVVAFTNDRPRLLDARIAKPMQFMSGKRRDPRHVEIVRFRNGNVTQVFRQSKLPKQFHAA
jgi:hypothetical protein